METAQSAIDLARIPREDEDPKDSERRLRVELAACYRIFDYLGWTEVIFNHITLRLPGPDHHFLINPFGLLYKEVTASNLVKIDLAGNIVGASEWPVNRAGYVIHSAIHAAREDARCVMHTHTNEGMAVACQKEGLRGDNFYSTQLVGRVAYHDFEGITVYDDEKARLVESLGEKDFLILRNHGLLTCGRTVAEALTNMRALQRAVEVQVMTDSCGRAIMPVSDEASERSQAAIRELASNDRTSEMVFAALVREIDRIDPSYRT